MLEGVGISLYTTSVVKEGINEHFSLSASEEDATVGADRVVTARESTGLS